MKFIIPIAMILMITSSSLNAETPTFDDPMAGEKLLHFSEQRWNVSELTNIPKVFEAQGIRSSHKGIQALFFEGLPYEGNPTRVFAWMGIPDSAKEQPVPGIVLVHGGKGTAFEDWVKLWMDRGYAAIAMDTCGALPIPYSADPRPRHQHSGPAGWGDFDQVSKPVEDHWVYHAVGAIVRAHSLLRVQPGVDTEKIGITGVSWGGFLTCIAASADSRFAFAAPVYGCGFLDRTVFAERLRESSSDGGNRWMNLWDPSKHLPAINIPMLWVNGTNDGFFFPYPWQDSHRLIPRHLRTMVLIRDLPHNQEIGSNLAEVEVFANSITRNAPPLVHIDSAELNGRILTVHYRPNIARAELIWTDCNENCDWKEKKWNALSIPVTENRIQCELPVEAELAFLNLTDSSGCTVSTEIFSK